MGFPCLNKSCITAPTALLLVLQITAQTSQDLPQVCKDSNNIIRYTSNDAFERSQIISLANGDNLVLAGTVNLYSYYEDIEICRTDSRGEILWATKLKLLGGFVFNKTKFSESQNGDLLMVANLSPGNEKGKWLAGIACLRSTGKLLWYNFYEIMPSANFQDYFLNCSIPATDKQGKIYLPFVFGSYYDEQQVFNIIKLSPNGNLLLQKSYIHGQSSFHQAGELDVHSSFEMGGLLNIFGRSSKLPIVNFQFNSTDLSLQKIRSYSATRYINEYNRPSIFNTIETNSGKYIGYGTSLLNTVWDNGGIGFTTVEFNRNQEPVKSFQVKIFPRFSNPGSLSFARNLIINDRGDLMYGISSHRKKFSLLAILDSNYNITMQKKIEPANAGIDYLFYDPLGYSKTNQLIFRFRNCINATKPCNLLHIYANQQLRSLSNCLKITDTSFVELYPFDLIPESFEIGRPVNQPLLQKNIVLSQENLVINTEAICSEKSICLTPKIEAADSICVDQSITRFTAHKGAACLSKINWKIDNSVTSSISFLKDSIIAVQFKKPWQGYISAELSSACGLLKDSIFITVYKPKIDLLKKDGICRDQTILLDAGTGYKNYLWQDGSSRSTYVANAPGKYWVKIADSRGCYNSDTSVVRNWLEPAKAFLRKNDSILCNKQGLELKANINTAAAYLWNTGATSSSIKINKAGSYWLQLTDDDGCVGRDSILLIEKTCPSQVFWPNAFSPNNNGHNDYFKPITSGSFIKFQLTIFNRWGEKIFESQQLNKGWDGTAKGRKQESGSYIWICNYQFPNEQPVIQKGSLLLIR